MIDSANTSNTLKLDTPHNTPNTMQQHSIPEFLSLLTNWARRPDAVNDLQEIFGASSHQSARLLEQIGQGDFSWIPSVEVLPSTLMEQAYGAYSRETGTIYLAADCPADRKESVLLEEIGHHIDSLFNAIETPGDEGALFSAVVRGITLSDEEITAIINEDDSTIINHNGYLIAVECASRSRKPVAPIRTVKPKPRPLPDTISSAVSYDLSISAPNSHGLILTGSGNLVGKGNAQSYNVIQSNRGRTTLIGGTGNNSLIGGTTGLDSLIGNSLSDTFVINNVNTKISENPNGGVDLVQTTLAAYTLAANIENLTGTGTGPQSLTGNTLANSITASNFGSTLVGGGGNDTLMGGTSNDSLVGGTGNDSLLGSAGDDIIYGGGGNDYISGGDGNDTLVSQLFGSSTLDGGSGNDVLVDSGFISTLLGGTGNDTYVIGNAGSTIIEDLYTGGTNLVQTKVTYTLAANVQNLTAIGAAKVTLTGNTLANVLTANNAGNRLIGGANGGIDSLVGGAGNDTFVVSSAGSTVTDTLGGIDLVETTLSSYTLGANLENLTYTGGAVSATLTGNDLANSITGGAGADSIIGVANAVAGVVDTLVGNDGNDTFVVADSLTSVTGGIGTDLIQSSVNFDLSATSVTGVENLTYTGAGSSTLTGTSLANSITGGAANDLITGNGGTDTLVGGTGNDTFVVDNTLSSVVEALNAGTDEIRSSVSYTLGANVENLTAIGAAKVTLTGNTLANVLTANNAGNRLIGGANGGIDSLVGGAGNDTFVVSSAGSTVTDTLGGIDLVETTLSSYTLGANLENLTYTGGAVSATLTGNDLANSITGGAGADSIIGVANAGYNAANGATWDTINGGGGTDTVEAAQQFVLGSNINTILFNGTGLLDLNQMSGAETPYTVGAITALNNTAAVTLMGNTLGGYSTGINLKANTSANTRLIGGNGNDTLRAEGVSQMLIGGSGNDSLTAHFAGGTTLVGGKAGDSLSGNDTLTASDPSISGTSNTFVLGDATTDYYQGPNKATIINFGFQNNPNYLSRADNLVLNGVRGDYKTATSGIGNLNVDLIYTAGSGNDTLATFINASNSDVTNLLSSSRTTYV